MTTFKIALIAAAFIALTGTANACYLGMAGNCGSTDEYDRMVRAQEEAKRAEEFNNEMLKIRCLNMKLTYRNLNRSSLDSVTIKMIDNNIDKCRASGLW